MADSEDQVQREPEAKPIEDQSEGFFAKFNYEYSCKVRRMLVIFASLMLVVVGVAKIVLPGTSDRTAAGYVKTFYFIVISIVMIAVEFGQGQA